MNTRPVGLFVGQHASVNLQRQVMTITGSLFFRS
jgi:hypothetical protein